MTCLFRFKKVKMVSIKEIIYHRSIIWVDGAYPHSRYLAFGIIVIGFSFVFTVVNLVGKRRAEKGERFFRLCAYVWYATPTRLSGSSLPKVHANYASSGQSILDYSNPSEPIVPPIPWSKGCLERFQVNNATTLFDNILDTTVPSKPTYSLETMTKGLQVFQHSATRQTNSIILFPLQSYTGTTHMFTSHA